MRLRAKRILSASLVAASIAGCGVLAPVVETPRLSPPPPAAAEGWPAVAFEATILRPPEVATGRRLGAVAHGSSGFVAVGYDEVDGVRNGHVSVSPDGLGWRPADDLRPFAGVELTDVAAGGPGFVAIGTRLGEPSLGEVSTAVLFTSEGGRAWTELPAVAEDASAYATGIVSAPGGLIAWGSVDGAGTVAWRSADGMTWERQLLADLDLADAVWTTVVADGDGWLAGGSVGKVPALFSSRDGRTWEPRELPTTRAGHEGYVDRLAIGPWGRVATGSDGAPCGPGGACAAATVRWWSDAGDEWGLMPDPSVDAPGFRDFVAPAGQRGLVTISGRRAYAGADGWTWTPLAGTGVEVAISDLLVAGDLLVAVGESTTPDGQATAVILTGGP